MAISINDTQHNETPFSVTVSIDVVILNWQPSELKVFVLNVAVLMFPGVLLIVVMLSVIMLIVVAPCSETYLLPWAW